MSTCDQPGCGGSIDRGYCDTCGMAPEPVGSGPVQGSSLLSSRVDVDRLLSTSGPTGGSGAIRRSGVGAGLVDIDPVELGDPAALVLHDLTVKESRRYCTVCEEPVGRRRGDRDARDSGFCTQCGHPFDFRPALESGMVVANQYEVGGPFAYGGMGWIYLARDRNVSGRWCVLKGLLDTADPDAADAAVAERRFLAEVVHPAIVEIHNFVKHGGQGYIVMEHVDGPSLKQLATEHREETGSPMPVEVAAAFLLAALPAISYLHQHGLVFCDFKPDNVIYHGEVVKLIDLGGVRRLDDQTGVVLGTPGYLAPEVVHFGPSVASDLYTVGRSLAVLILDWPAWQGDDLDKLPPREDHQVLVDHDCLWRFLQRACAPEPEQRFRTADEMADALHGVLSQVAAARDGRARPRTGTRWGPPRPMLDGPDWRALPTPTLPNHPRLDNLVAGLSDGDPEAAVALAGTQSELSWADAASVVLAHCELGAHDAAVDAIDHLDTSSPEAEGHESTLEAAANYLRGVLALASGAPGDAVDYFDAAYAVAPGEAACALAHATALEAAGSDAQLDEAALLYHQVAVTDPAWLPAVAGLSRVLTELGRPAEGARALTAIPRIHPLRADALALACATVEEQGFDETVAVAAVEQLRTEPAGSRDTSHAELAVAFYRAVLAAVARGESLDGVSLKHRASPRALAKATEAALLELAALTPNPGRRHELLDCAAQTRPWSIW